eukprot:COSAG06_NODE_3078_length_5888_cov_24.975643_3_plen_93_part_00
MVASGVDVADVLLYSTIECYYCEYVGMVGMMGMHGGYGAAARTLDILELCGSHSQLCLNAFDVRAGERLQRTRAAAARRQAGRQAVLSKRVL